MENLDVILKKYTSEVENHLQGATFIAVNAKGETLYSKAFGRRTFELPKVVPLQTDSVLWIASLTKLVTAIACMVAVDQGLITLDQNVREIVPELNDLDLLVGFEESEEKLRKPVVKKVDAPISLRQLLSHQSGFTYDQLHSGLQEWSKCVGRSEWTMTGSYGGYMHPLIFEPGSGWVYGCGMDWAGRAVEIVSGMTLEAFMQKHIFGPLSMNDTTFHPEHRPDLQSRQTDLAWRDHSTGSLALGKNPWCAGGPAKDNCGGVGLYSTADDYAKLLKAVLSPSCPILVQSSVDEILKSQLCGDAQAAFMESVNGEARKHLGQTWPPGENKGTFGLSASINLEGFEGRRRSGSANWSGMPGLHAWVDPETGIAGLLTTQVLPPGDPIVTKCLLELETELYSYLRSDLAVRNDI